MISDSIWLNLQIWFDYNKINCTHRFQFESASVWLVISHQTRLGFMIWFATHCSYLFHHFQFDSAIMVQFLIIICYTIFFSFLVWFNYHYLTHCFWCDEYFMIKFDSWVEQGKASSAWLKIGGNKQVDWSINIPCAWVHKKMKLWVSNLGHRPKFENIE